MQYLSILLAVIIAAFVSVEATIPDYIKRCNKHDLDLNKCIQNSINSLRSQLATGIPELNVPTLDPLHLDQLILNLGNGVSAVCKNLELSGAKNFEIHDLVANLDDDTYAFDIKFPEINARGEYEINTTLSTLHLEGKGPITLTAKSVSGRGTLHGKKVPHGGETRYYYPKMDLHLEVETYHMNLENLFGADPTIGDVTNKVLNTEKTAVLATILPGIEKAVIEKILTAANKISKVISYEEMFGS